MSDFTQIHFEHLAYVIRNTTTREELIKGLIKMCKDSNPRFKQDKFMKAANLEYSSIS
jgi:hypothetical protein